MKKGVLQNTKNEYLSLNNTQRFKGTALKNT